MKKLFLTYFDNFFHPFAFHEAHAKGEKEALSFLEIMSLSWLFKIVRTFYYFMGLHFIVFLMNRGAHSSIEASFAKQKYLFYWVLVGVIFYPVTLWALGKFWAVIIRFFCVLYAKEDLSDLNKRITTVANLSLLSQGLLLVPVIGEFLLPFAFFFLIFVGLIKNLGFSVLQAFLVLLAPFFLFLLLIVLGLGYVLLLFNMI